MRTRTSCPSRSTLRSHSWYSGESGVRSMNPVYRELLNAGEFLDKVISHNEGGANKDLRAFTKELMALCEKWDR